MPPSKSPRQIALTALKNLSNEPLDTKAPLSRHFHAEILDPEGAAYEDRAVALVATSAVELALEAAILARFVPLDDNERRDLFSVDSDSPLSSFAAKIRIGRAMGIYGPRFKSDLIVIKTIRNAFAHAPRHIDFDTQEIRDACAIMHAAEGEWGSEIHPSEYAKTIFVEATKSFAVHLFAAAKDPSSPIQDDATVPVFRDT